MLSGNGIPLHRITSLGYGNFCILGYSASKSQKGERQQAVPDQPFQFQGVGNDVSQSCPQGVQHPESRLNFGLHGTSDLHGSSIFNTVAGLHNPLQEQFTASQREYEALWKDTFSRLDRCFEDDRINGVAFAVKWIKKGEDFMLRDNAVRNMPFQFYYVCFSVQEFENDYHNPRETVSTTQSRTVSHITTKLDEFDATQQRWLYSMRPPKPSPTTPSTPRASPTSSRRHARGASPAKTLILTTRLSTAKSESMAHTARIMSWRRCGMSNSTLGQSTTRWEWVILYLKMKLTICLVGNEPFPFPFPSTTTPTLVFINNPAPAPTGPRAMNSTPVPDPYPPVYIPGPPQTPNTNTGGFSPAPGSGSRAHLSQHHQGSSPASGLQNEFSIRGMAGKGVNGGSLRYANMGQAYNNRPTRGRGTVDPSLNLNAEPVGGAARRAENGGGNSSAGGGGGVPRGRGAVYAARRQLKIVRRIQGRN
ncbi:hypothetical protein DL98DRAFT_536695 [Cadophora sp. DSE1049]|nr:hypothetical protein DL98DRAFT_536695 [Cadophora sp. DSE1049]